MSQPAEKAPVTPSGRHLVKTGKEHGRITDMGTEALAEAETRKKKEEKLEKELAAQAAKKVKKAAPGTTRKKEKIKIRGKAYTAALKTVDPKKLYPLAEALELIKKVSFSKFNGSVDVHLNVRETGLKGGVEFPHPTGKKQTIRLADDLLIKELEAGKINFSFLLATPAMMPKLLKFAKLLGPRGLMPNPKAGTITDKPEESIKKLAGKIAFKTEAKSPTIHLTIGKVDSSSKQLKENFTALFEAVGGNNILKAVIAPTMGPGIKIDLDSLNKTS